MRRTGVKHTMKRIGVSAAIAMVILVADYIIGNFISFIFDDSATLSVVKNLFSSSAKDDLEDFEDNSNFKVFNVGYDKQLVAIRDEYNDSIGSEVVTDRKTLMTLLDIAEKSDYRYLFLDIRFEKGLETEQDSILFSKIKSMPRLAISTHTKDGGYEIADPGLREKSGYADYRSTYFSGFTRYDFLQNDSLSVALKMYREIDGGDIRRIGPFFFSDGKLCHNMQFLRFKDSDVMDLGDDPDAISKYPPFGGEILNILNEDQLIDLMKGKIIVVGDMVHDIHTTYAGDVPGPLLNIRAYEALRSGYHLVDWKLTSLLFIIYACISYFVLYIHTLKIPEKIRKPLFKHPIIIFIFLNIGWGGVMFLVKVMAFCKFGASIIPAVPAFIFSVLSMPDNYEDFKKNNSVANSNKNKTSDE